MNSRVGHEDKGDQELAKVELLFDGGVGCGERIGDEGHGVFNGPGFGGGLLLVVLFGLAAGFGAWGFADECIVNCLDMHVLPSQLPRQYMPTQFLELLFTKIPIL